jgi:hypothetical protein
MQAATFFLNWVSEVCGQIEAMSVAPDSKQQRT